MIEELMMLFEIATIALLPRDDIAGSRGCEDAGCGYLYKLSFLTTITVSINTRTCQPAALEEC